MPTHTNNYGFATLREQESKRIPIVVTNVAIETDASLKLRWVIVSNILTPLCIKFWQ
ncbi:MAG: hypothetical protein AAFV71_03305 [Cyanobacteria bacterium J06633_8]